MKSFTAGSGFLKLIAVCISVEVMRYIYLLMLLSVAGHASGQTTGGPGKKSPTRVAEIHPGAVWMDDRDSVINAHGGGILFRKNKYYWYGERRGSSASQGVNVYSSPDLLHWTYEGLALEQETTDTTSEIRTGCLMERPKVIYNDRTRQYVMWFHLELKGKGYKAARAGVAVSDRPTGPFRYIGSMRPNGNMSRDMTLFRDTNGDAYLIYSSRENYDLHIAKLTDDYLSVTTADSMVFSKHREAPAVMKYKDKFYMITSGCTGWKPNEAWLHRASSMLGPWERVPGNPMRGPGAALTFDAQSTYILPVEGKKQAYVFMADRWKPGDLKDSRYIWLPVSFREDIPKVEWSDAWNLGTSPR
jgi:beta-xylosidase